MATLVKNVWIEGTYYGPDHGNADDVPAVYVDLIPADAWSSPPMVARMPAAEVVAEAPRVSRALPYELVAEADALGIDVNARWGEKRLRAEIAAAKNRPDQEAHSGTE